MELPLTSRELTRQTRRRGMHAARVIVPGAISAVLVTLALFEPRVHAETVGRICFFVSLAFQYAVVYLAAPLLTADLIARETEERTLPLLLLANARNMDIVISKYLPVLILCELLIISTMPMIAFAGFFGGVSSGVGVTATFTNMGAAAACAALGIVASALVHRSRTALGLALMFALGFGWLNQVIVRRMVSSTWRDAELATAIREFAPAHALAAAVAVASLLAASWLISRKAVAPVVRLGSRARAGRTTRDVRGSSDAFRKLVASAGAQRGDGTRLLLALMLVAGTVACYWIGPWAIPVLIAFIAYQTASGVRGLIQSGELDDLRLVPTDRWHLGDAVFHRHFVSALYFIPAFMLAVGTSGVSLGHWLADLVFVFANGLLSFALVRFVVAISAERAPSKSPAVSALLALWVVFGTTLIASLIAMLVAYLGALFVAWFRIPFPGGSAALPTVQWLTWFIAVFLMFMGGSREPRLRFAHHIERQLYSANHQA